MPLKKGAFLFFLGWRRFAHRLDHEPRLLVARFERGLTQQDIADHLGKTAAAISEMVRGKVQVSASALSKFAVLPDKSIELFYGIYVGVNFFLYFLCR
jgi:transcriptional regulator with XRE-family HTH domain